jgi:hypothetical protein
VSCVCRSYELFGREPHRACDPFRDETVRWPRYLRGVMGEPAADYGPLAFGDSVCPECESHRIEVVASFVPAADDGTAETQLGRCEDCGESLRREASTVTSGPWRVTGF